MVAMGQRISWGSMSLTTVSTYPPPLSLSLTHTHTHTLATLSCQITVSVLYKTVSKTFDLEFDQTNIAPRRSAGGSCISVVDAVAGWKEHIQSLKSLKEKTYLGSPAVSNAAASDTTGLGWLAKFIEACRGCDIDFITIHWYVHDKFTFFISTRVICVD